MNCKPGDLAIIVRAPKEVQHHIGKVVELGHRLLTSWDGWPCWELKHPFRDVVNGRRGTCYGVADRDLRPIRPDDGEDEMLRIAGKPQEKKEIA